MAEEMLPGLKLFNRGKVRDIYDLGDNIILIDELLTPDSSRFWPADGYRPCKTPESFDKQFVRDYLINLPWDMKSPPPVLPPEIVQKTREIYAEALRRLTQ